MNRLLVLTLAFSGCADTFSGSATNPGGFGATQGGVQDLRLARELVKNGKVPPAAAFLVEGMFSEHDLPLAGAPCATLFCLRGASGVAPLLDGTPAGWMQIGLSSSIDPATYQRPGTTFIATVDISGSMGWEYANEEQTYPTPAALAKKLLTRIGAALGPDDRLAIVTYGSDASTRLGLTRGNEHTAIQGAIDSLAYGGSTNMEAGLTLAYSLAETARQTTTGPVRLLLFTDEQPNVGATSPTAFAGLAQGGATHDVGLTVFGLGLGLGQEVMVAMSHLRGGNAFSLSKKVDVDTIMDNDWPWFSQPIAHELRVHVLPTVGTVVSSYGFPTGGPVAEPSFDVATVFLSKRRGALLVRLAADAGFALTGPTAEADLAYKTPAGESITQTLHIGSPVSPMDERGQRFDQPSVARTVALALLVSSMKDAATTYATDTDAAAAAMRTADTRFTEDTAKLASPDLDQEVAFSHALLTLMQAGAAQGTLYPE